MKYFFKVKWKIEPEKNQEIIFNNEIMIERKKPAPVVEFYNNARETIHGILRMIFPHMSNKITILECNLIDS